MSAVFFFTPLPFYDLRNLPPTRRDGFKKQKTTEEDFKDRATSWYYLVRRSVDFASGLTLLSTEQRVVVSLLLVLKIVDAAALIFLLKFFYQDYWFGLQNSLEKALGVFMCILNIFTLTVCSALVAGGSLYSSGWGWILVGAHLLFFTLWVMFAFSYMNDDHKDDHNGNLQAPAAQKNAGNSHGQLNPLWRGGATGGLRLSAGTLNF